MIREILRDVHRLDEVVTARLGRPRQVLIGVVIVLELGTDIREIDHVGASARGMIETALVILLFSVLRLRQLGKLHEHAGRRAESGRGRGP